MAPPHQQHADGDHRPAPGKKPEVPEEPLPARSCFVDVVQAEHLVVDDAFDKVERSEADEHRRDEIAGRPAEMAKAAGPPQDEEAGEDEDVGTGVEDTIPESIQF